jgi:hypothetical protein
MSSGDIFPALANKSDSKSLILGSDLLSFCAVDDSGTSGGTSGGKVSGDALFGGLSLNLLLFFERLIFLSDRYYYFISKIKNMLNNGKKRKRERGMLK